MTSATARRERWVYYAACVWSVCFAAPHTWWALGASFGFPGGPANYDRWMTSWWRYLYDVIVVLLSVLGAVVAVSLRPACASRFRRVFRPMAWVAAALLTVRGVAGLVVDGMADPIWWPTFLIGGLLFGSVAWLSRAADTQTTITTQRA